MQPFDYACAYVTALTGRVDSVIDWRLIHDREKGATAINLRGTLSECWAALCSYNQAGYGVFLTIQEMDGTGRELGNVARIRTHALDLDNPASAAADYARAIGTYPQPQFAVFTSPGKAHVYWISTPYRDNARYEQIQRKLAALYNGDGAVIDAARVLRLPGTYHCKGEPHLITCQALAGFGQVVAPETLEGTLATVQVHVGGHDRTELGNPDMSAPSFAEAVAALNALDPNDLDRLAWLGVSSAFKQAAWLHATPEMIQATWQAWCARYAEDDPAENTKLWRSVRNTEVGWKYLARRDPNTHARMLFTTPGMPAPPVPTYNPAPVSRAEPEPPPAVPTDRMLTPEQCKAYFWGCIFVSELGTILTPSGRLMNSTQFNGHYGGRLFIVTQDGKTSDEPWKAALRSTEWRIPIVDHLRFVPVRASGELIMDAMGRTGINTYKPATITHKAGDASLFLDHIYRIMPTPADAEGYLDYLAHNVQYPGEKIPWAYLLQSAEGAGKGVIKMVMQHAMGAPYVHFPNAKELVESGSKFNGWMRGKLFILVDEIKVDERRDMIEVLKPMISEKEIEIQSKGVDQKKEDNYSNWTFFSNYKNAIPINQNARRFAIIYSSIQSKADLIARGMNDAYFATLYGWLENGDGKEIVTDYLMRRPVVRGSLGGRAPETSSTTEAVVNSRGVIEQTISDCVEDGRAGFRGGWVSTLAVAQVLREQGNRANGKTIAGAIEGMGYYNRGRAIRAYPQEAMTTRATLYSLRPADDVMHYGRLQGYE